MKHSHLIARLAIYAGIFFSGTAVPTFVMLARSSPTMRASADAKKMNMNVLFDKGPLTLLVHKDFPAQKHYMLLDRDRQITFSGGAVLRSRESARSEVDLVIGTDFSVSCIFNPNIRSDIREFTVTLDDFALTDLNGDGQFDLRVTIEPQARIDVWYASDWQEVVIAEGGKYEKRLIDGTSVTFSLSDGQWASQTDG